MSTRTRQFAKDHHSNDYWPEFAGCRSATSSRLRSMADGEKKSFKPFKILRWIFIASGIVFIFLALKTPSKAGPHVDRSVQQEQAQAFQEKISSLASAHQQGSEAEVSLESGEVNAAIAESLSTPEAQTQLTQTAATPINATESKPANNQPSEQAGDGQIKDVRVEFSNDVVTGYFTTQQYGKEIHLTVAGRLGCKDGYATFEPTAFKIGDLSVPVSFVNPSLQKKLADPITHEKLKLPEFVADLRIVNGRLFVVER
jgi:hypothetical protein